MSALMNDHRRYKKLALALALAIPTMLKAQDSDLTWYNPVAKAQAAAGITVSTPKLGGPVAAIQRPLLKRLPVSPRVQARLDLVIEKAKGDPRQIVDQLLEGEGDEAPQALHAALLSLAPQVGVPKTDAVQPDSKDGSIQERPLVDSGSKPGIPHVAYAAGRLMDRRMKPRPGDVELLHDAIRLMGHYGKAEGAREMDGEVRQALHRTIEAGDALQILSSKALGQLGDIDMAREIIRNPARYPGASVADFGPQALEEFGKAQHAALQQHQGDAAFWQGVRLRNKGKEKELAVDLARAGDGGAGLAFERHLALDAYGSKDPDARMANAIQAALDNPPGSRARYVANSIVATQFDDALIKVGGYIHAPKTMAMVVKAIDHDLKIVFGDEPWDYSNLVFLGDAPTYLTSSYHNWETHQRDFPMDHAPQLEALFRKYYKPRIRIETETSAYEPRVAMQLSLYGRHLGLGIIDFQGREDFVVRRKAERISYGFPAPFQANDLRFTLKYYKEVGEHGNAFTCIQAGHITSLEDF